MVFQKKKYAPKRKLVRRKRLARKPTSLVNRALHPIPQRFITKMKYAELVTTDGNGHFYFNLNSVFDPNRSGIGHQPYGHDTLQTLYNRYRVISCGWRIQPTAISTTAIWPLQIASIPANEQLIFGTLSEVRENPRAKYIVQNPGAGVMTLSGKSYLPSLVGRNKAQYMADDRYQAIMGASPNEQAILNVVCSANGTDTPTPGALFNVMLEYTVEFFDIKHLAQS